MNFLHCLLHFRVQGNCSLGPLLAECTWSSVKNTVQILAFRAMNLSGKENESWLLFRLPLFHKTCPGFLSGANTWILQTLQLWHKHFTCSLECLHTDKCWSSFISHPHGPQGTHCSLLPAQLYWGLGACKCFFTGTASLLWASPPHTDLAEIVFYHSTGVSLQSQGFLLHSLLSSPTI